MHTLTEAVELSSQLLTHLGFFRCLCLFTLVITSTFASNGVFEQLLRKLFLLDLTEQLLPQLVETLFLLFDRVSKLVLDLPRFF